MKGLQPILSSGLLPGRLVDARALELRGSQRDRPEELANHRVKQRRQLAVDGRFTVERCALITTADWPARTSDISEIGVDVRFAPANTVGRFLSELTGSPASLTIRVVDYPGEWLLDLPLLTKSFEAWSAESLALSREPPRASLAALWHAHLATLDAKAPANEQAAITAARLFTEYLLACRNEHYAMSLLPPGRFLMPGELAGSPALTFAPLDLPGVGLPPADSLWAMMRRRGVHEDPVR